MRLVGANWKSGNLVEAERYLALCPEEHRLWEWKFYKKQCRLLVVQSHLSTTKFRDYALLDGKIKFFHADDPPKTGLKQVQVSNGKVVLERWTEEDLSLDLNNILPVMHKTYTLKITARQTSPDGRHVAIGLTVKYRETHPQIRGTLFEEYYLLLLDLNTGAKEQTFRFYDRYVNQICFNRNGSHLAVATTSSRRRDRTSTRKKQDYQVSILSVEKGESVRTFPRQQDSIWGLAFSRDGKLLAVAGSDIKVWDTTPSWKPLRLSNHARAVFAIAISPDNRFVASASGHSPKNDARGIIISELETGKEAFRLADEKVDKNEFYRLEFSRDGHFLAAASKSGVTVWDIRKRVRVFHETGLFHCATFSTDGRHLAATGRMKRTVVWNLNDQSIVLDVPAGGYGVAFSPDGRTLAVTLNRQFSVWDIESGKKPMIPPQERMFSVSRIIRMVAR